MALGYANAQQQQSEICNFFGWTLRHATGQPMPSQPRVDRRRDPLRIR